jgi:hypothetical protein
LRDILQNDIITLTASRQLPRQSTQWWPTEVSVLHLPK